MSGPAAVQPKLREPQALIQGNQQRSESIIKYIKVVVSYNSQPSLMSKRGELTPRYSSADGEELVR